VRGRWGRYICCFNSFDTDPSTGDTNTTSDNTDSVETDSGTPILDRLLRMLSVHGPASENPTPVDNSELVSTSFPDNDATTRTTTTTRPRPNAPTYSASFGNDDTVSSPEPLETTEEPQEEPEVVAEGTETEAVTQDIGGGEPSEKPSNVLPWTLLGLIAVLNFAWFYTRKPPTI
jgi:hypothetical protein